ncbi:DNA ligase [Undibacterium fentianense]|uniref:DNA ligase n=1 Tax=Undibacterium fentianense TaxID=2828728 RepID=A0A941E006_9BURK|nr:DNA ligase [Undibacterium fentianense]MBR7798477.1 DNA ligase [Undibacterium fentianense]
MHRFQKHGQGNNSSMHESQPFSRRFFLNYGLSVMNFLATTALAKSSLLPKELIDELRGAIQGKPELPLVLPTALDNIAQLRQDAGYYLMSEKLDGIRAFWDGNRLFFRSGREINVPSWFTQKFPSTALDGELWLGRGQFERLSAAVRHQQANDAEWQTIQYCLFEAPFALGDFQHRVQNLNALVRRLQIPWLRVIQQEPIKSSSQVATKLKEVELQKGEGLVLHLATAEFQSGRSTAVYKLKPQHDAEAVVLAIQPGRGKYEGMMGALLLETPDGKRFKLGTGFDDHCRKNPPSVGSIVTYRYRDLTSNGLPKFASFVRIYHPE